MPRLPWSKEEKPELTPGQRLSFISTEITNYASANNVPPYVLVFGLGGAAFFGSALVYRRYFRRFQTGDWIMPNHFAKKRWIKGQVLSVGDADNFRLYHTPGIGWSWPMKFRRIPSTPATQRNQTIHIRIAGADAPEAAHFGRPAQPYSREALDWLKSKIQGRRVYCQLIRKDQYSRVLAHAFLAPRILPGTWFRGKPISLEMIKSGWATTYTQTGAEYGDWGKEEFLRLEAEAKAAKRGMWGKGTSGETPAEYKRRYAALGSEEKAVKETAKKLLGVPRRPWWNRLFSRS